MRVGEGWGKLLHESVPPCLAAKHTRRNALQLGQLGACCHFSTLEVEARGPRFKVVLSKSEASLGSWRRVSNRGRDQGVGRHDTAW